MYGFFSKVCYMFSLDYAAFHEGRATVYMRIVFNRWQSPGLGAEGTQGRRCHLRLSIVITELHIVVIV